MSAACDPEKKPEEEEEDAVAGELLYFGGTNWDSMGRRGPNTSANLMAPTRLRPLLGVDIRLVASGCTSAHCVAVDASGRCYTWGRNERGQLGYGDTLQRNLPTILSELAKYKIVKAGAGRSHTVVVTDEGKSFAFGWNKHGQLGSGSTKNEIESSPVPCLVTEATNAVCGSDFTVWLTSVEGSSILTAGLPQYGQLGHGTDNEYNAKDASVRLVYEPQPRPRAISAFSAKVIVKVACGTNHTVAVDSNGYVYTWGFGGYGRLGHREQKDEWAPRQVEVFQRQNVLPPNAVVSAGATSSACTAGGGQLYMWGKLKNTGDDWMYPKPVMDLSGWNIRCMDSGYMHHVVGADDSCISWGTAAYGELGYGPLGQKSSANPKKVDSLEGLHVIGCACGSGLSMVIIDRASAGDRLGQIDVYDGDASSEGAADDKKASETRQKKNSAKSSNSKKRKSHDRSEPEEEHEDNGEDDDMNGEFKNSKGKRGGASSRGRKSAGRGRGRSKSSEAKSSSAKGRGRSKSKEKISSRGRGRGKAGRKAKK